LLHGTRGPSSQVHQFFEIETGIRHRAF